jgi:hypothetical protein
MKNQKHFRLFIVSFAIFAASILLISELPAQRPGNGNAGHAGFGQGHMSGQGLNLTDEQKSTLRSTVETLREQGATREEIRATVDALFVKWGIERPSRNGKFGKGGAHGARANLTDEQRETVQATVQEMRANDASREEIRAAIKALFDGWGIEMPERGFHRAGAGFGDLLTDDQRDMLHATVQDLRDKDATREEIHAAVQALFDEWGIEMPERDFRGPHGRFGDLLTDEQQETIKTTVQELRDNDATREEIHAAVQALFDKWDIEMPDRDFTGPHGRFGDLLTDEQQETIKTTVQELRDNDATREEIHAAVQALFDEWGIERPEYKKGCGRKGHGDMFKDLTPEQQQAVKDLTKEMRKDGATRHEIRDAVKQLLEDWGVDGDDGMGMLNKEDGARKAKNAPNPFNPTTTISYTLQENGPVSVKVYNTQGRLIRTLLEGEGFEGSHQVMWDGRNDRGEFVSSGMYFYKIIANNEIVTERMTLMK